VLQIEADANDVSSAISAIEVIVKAHDNVILVFTYAVMF